jgi:hypothetical protein
VTLSVPPRAQVAPSATWDTEVLTVVVSGSCSIGTGSYRAGDLRVQKASCRQPAVVAGPDGASLLMILGDRRRMAPTESEQPAWTDDWTGLFAHLLHPLAA